MLENYLEWFKWYRDKGYTGFYQDETSVFKNMAQRKSIVFRWGRIGLLQGPSGSGDRAIVSHLGSAEKDLLDGCLVLYRGAKSSKDADYHSDGRSIFSLAWEQGVSSDEGTWKRTVLVLDRATYHT